MTILVPTDFSDNANHALEYAIEFANAMKARLVLTHVVSESEDGPDDIHNAAERLAIISRTLTKEFSQIACEVNVSVGNIVEEIVALADDKNADLIVMGTRGAANLGKLLFGSNTAMVIEQSHCPVLSVPADFSFRKPSKMLFSTNFSREDLKAAVQFVNLAKAFHSTVVIAHVSVEHEREDVEKSMVKIFARDVRRLSGYDNIICRFSSENTISMGLDKLIGETGADIIALSTRKRGLLEKVFNPSITKKYSLQADIPLLAFHSESLVEA